MSRKQSALTNEKSGEKLLCNRVLIFHRHPRMDKNTLCYKKDCVMPDSTLLNLLPVFLSGSSQWPTFWALLSHPRPVCSSLLDLG